uniref:Uncharacterized protein n=1 Tax=Avena sativa TaxID=4498 RepID=A0ACD5USU1_AVESA
MATKMVAAVMVVAILALATAGHVMATGGTGPRSYLTSWDGPACTTNTGRMSSVGTCGCSTVRFHGGHEFNFRGETATLYSEHGCAGTPYQVFEDTQACGDFGWRSIHIDC